MLMIQMPPPLPEGVVIMHAVDALVPVLIVALLVAGLIAYLRMRHRGTQSATLPPALLQPIDDRLGRLEQAVEAIGIQVERITESQRFVTKLLTDDNRSPARLPSARE